MQRKRPFESLCRCDRPAATDILEQECCDSSIVSPRSRSSERFGSGREACSTSDRVKRTISLGCSTVKAGR